MRSSISIPLRGIGSHSILNESGSLHYESSRALAPSQSLFLHVAVTPYYDHLYSTPTLILISSIPELEMFFSSIPPTSTLYLDLGGKNLRRHGTISLVTILISPERVI